MFKPKPMNHFFLSLGSNQEPAKNVPLMVQALLQISPTIDISRVVRTEPKGFDSPYTFFNLAARIESPLDAKALKEKLVKIEEKLGRDRTHPNRKLRDRPADIDILFEGNPCEDRIPLSWLPPEPYVRPTLLELIHFLQLNCPEPVPPLPPGVPLQIGGQSFGTQPQHLQRSAVLQKLVSIKK